MKFNKWFFEQFGKGKSYDVYFELKAKRESLKKELEVVEKQIQKMDEFRSMKKAALYAWNIKDIDKGVEDVE
jgi:chaperonin cofactor prefoldin